MRNYSSIRTEFLCGGITSIVTEFLIGRICLIGAELFDWGGIVELERARTLWNLLELSFSLVIIVCYLGECTGKSEMLYQIVTENN